MTKSSLKELSFHCFILSGSLTSSYHHFIHELHSLIHPSSMAIRRSKRQQRQPQHLTGNPRRGTARRISFPKIKNIFSIFCGHFYNLISPQDLWVNHHKSQPALPEPSEYIPSVYDTAIAREKKAKRLQRNINLSSTGIRIHMVPTSGTPTFSCRSCHTSGFLDEGGYCFAAQPSQASVVDMKVSLAPTPQVQPPNLLLQKVS